MQGRRSTMNCKLGQYSNPTTTNSRNPSCVHNVYAHSLIIIMDLKCLLRLNHCAKHYNDKMKCNVKSSSTIETIGSK